MIMWSANSCNQVGHRLLSRVSNRVVNSRNKAGYKLFNTVLTSHVNS
jgi:hypothetical protein